MTTRASQDTLHLEDQLCFALYAATHAITRRYRPLLDQIGLTYPQYLVMLILWQDGCVTIGQVARRLELDSHAVTPLVARLEAAGLVQRAGGVDRRQVMITATNRGREMREAAARAQAQVAGDTGLVSSDLADLRLRLRVLTQQLTPDTQCFPAPSGRAETTERNLQ